jgi:hypothetical protein
VLCRRRDVCRKQNRTALMICSYTATLPLHRQLLAQQLRRRYGTKSPKHAGYLYMLVLNVSTRFV